MRNHRSTHFVLLVFIAVLAMGLQPLYAAETLTLSDISPKQAGAEVAVGGMGTGKITIRIFKPQETVVWKKLATKGRPDHFWDASFTLPNAVTGRYRIEVVSPQGRVSKTFSVIAAKNEADKGRVSVLAFHEGGLLLRRWAEAKQNDVRVVVDGAPFLLNPPALAKNETVYVPLRPLIDYIAGTVETTGKITTISKSVNSLAFSLGNRVARKNGKRFIMKKPAISINKTIYVPISMFGDAFGYKVEISADNAFARLGSKEKKEWWYTFPTMAEHALADGVQPKAVRGNFGASFGWGLYGQRLSYEGDKSKVGPHIQKNRKIVTYMEASGQPRVYALGFKRAKNGRLKYSTDKLKYAVPELNAWGWDDKRLAAKGVNYVKYLGMHDAVEEEDFIKPNYTLKKTGLAMPTYPNGHRAKGKSDNGLPYPLNAKVYDATCAKQLDGRIFMQPKIPYQGKRTAGLIGLKTKADQTAYYRLVMFRKDPAAPFWRSHNEVVAKRLVEYGRDGCWFDNMSPWDNFYSTDRAFGDWSEKLFNRFLQKRHSAAELKAIGIDDLARFNIREYVAQKTKERYPKIPANRALKDEGWLEDAVWARYKIFKMKSGRSYLKHLYGSMKSAAARAGRREGWMVSGNDMPKLDHGWTRDDWLDVVGVELSTSWSTAFGQRGLMPLPKGQMSVVYKTAREIMQGPHPMVWYYAKKERGKKNIGKAVLSEAFANGAFVKHAENTIGSSEDHRWLNTFSAKEEQTLQSRYYHYDVGLVYSTAEQLGNATPGLINGTHIDKQLAVQGYWGFAQAMTEAHIPYQVVPDWKLNRQRLKEYSTLIYPHAECIDDELLPLLKEFVEKGGRLVLTGPAGLRHGRKGYFQRRKTPLLNTLVGVDTSKAPGNRWSQHKNSQRSQNSRQIGGGSVGWTSDPVGYTYWHKDGDRAQLLPAMVKLIGGTSLFDGRGLTGYTGSCLWRSGDGRTLYVDLYNTDIDVKADRLRPQGAMSFRIKLPFYDGMPSVRVVSPAGNYSPKASMADGWLRVDIPKLQHYASVIIRTAP